MLKATGPTGAAAQKPESVSGIVSQKVRFGVRLVLLSNGKKVQGKPAPQGHHELIHVGKAREQGGRDEGVGKQEQEGVAGIMYIIVR